MASPLFGTEEFDEQEKKIIRRLLTQKLGGSHLSVRPGSGGTKFAYIESWKAIELANSIFGFDGWSSQIVDITPDFIEQIAGGKFRVGVTAVVKVMLKDGTFHEDVGYGICDNPSKGTAIENAKKEAVSDARKRALRLFGNALGNCIYDKEHIKKVKSKISASATGTVSYDQLRANLGTLDDLCQTQATPTPVPSTIPQQVYQQQTYQQHGQQAQPDSAAYDYQHTLQAVPDGDGSGYADHEDHATEEEGAILDQPPAPQQQTGQARFPFTRPFGKTSPTGTQTGATSMPIKRNGFNAVTVKR